MFKKIFDFFIFTSLFIAICAMLMVYQTSILFNISFPFAVYGFVLSGAVCSYNFHWYLTPPHITGESEKLKWNINNRNLHLVLFIISLLSAGIFSLLLLEHWLWLGVTAFLTFLYSAPKIQHPLFIKLRKIAIAKTIFLAFAWAHVTTLFPLVITVKTLQAEHIWFVVNRFFFLYAICIVFDRRDVESDRKAGIKSLITFFDEKGVDRLFWSSLIVFLGTCIVLLQWFSLLYVLLLIVPACILAALYYPSKQNFSDYLYYFILDGLMMLSAPLLILIKFAR